jgi:hypothetical protein
MIRRTVNVWRLLAVLILAGCHEPTAPEVSTLHSEYRPGTIRAVNVEVRPDVVRFAVTAQWARQYSWQVFLDTDNDHGTGYGWGYDYVVNGAAPIGPELAPVLPLDDMGWDGPPTGEARFTVVGDRLDVRIPRQAIGRAGQQGFGWYLQVVSRDGSMVAYRVGRFVPLD